MGEVYRARDRRLDRFVAIPVIREQCPSVVLPHGHVRLRGIGRRPSGAHSAVILRQHPSQARVRARRPGRTLLAGRWRIQSARLRRTFMHGRCDDEGLRLLSLVRSVTGRNYWSICCGREMGRRGSAAWWLPRSHSLRCCFRSDRVSCMEGIVCADLLRHAGAIENASTYGRAVAAPQFY